MAVHPLLLAVRTLRVALISHAIEKQPPHPDAAKRLIDLVPQIAREKLDDRQVAQLWGELQLLLIEGEGRPEDATAWGQIRNAADAGLVGLLKRKEWDGLLDIFAREIFPRLAGAVAAPRSARMQACIETTTRLRELGERPAGRKYGWLLQHIAEMQYPRFGTSGWRARMGVDFSWRRATAVAQAIVEYVVDSGLSAKPLTIGYDSRINGDRVAALVAEIAVANGLQVHLASRETPSPALISYITEKLGVADNAGLINCTPSHNPVKDPGQRKYLGTEYHGIRYNVPYGAVAPSRATDTIGRRAMELLLEERMVPADHARGSVSYFDPLEDYVTAAISDLNQVVTLPNGQQGSGIERMRQYWGAAEAMVVIDEMHSASRNYLRRVCDRLGIRYTVLHGEKDPLLGELMYANPEPPHISGCQQAVRELHAQYPRIIGVGMDTDSDRFGVVDEQGNYVMMNQVLTMLADYMLTLAFDGQPGRIIRNMVTTRMLDRVAEAHADKVIPPADRDAIVIHAAAPSYEVVLGDPQRQSGFLTYVVPVGFKFIADVMMGDLQTLLATGEKDPKKLQAAFRKGLQNLLIAGEESNGMTSRGHTPDKDGLWGALLTLQMCAVHGKPIAEIWAEVADRYGKLVSVRRDVEAPDVAKIALVNAYLDRYAGDALGMAADDDPLAANLTPVYCGGVRGELVEVIYHDTDGSECYLAIRASGTEPINRIYVECPTEAQRDVLVQAVGEELERQTVQAIEKATDLSSILDLLAAVELPPADGRDLPATYTDRVIGPAIARIREIAGSKAEEMVQLADEQLAERNPAKAGTLYVE